MTESKHNVPNWRDHTQAGDNHTVLAEYDDGSAITLLGYTGGGSPLGAWGQLHLMRHMPDGDTHTRTYRAIEAWCETASDRRGQYVADPEMNRGFGAAALIIFAVIWLVLGLLAGWLL